MRTLPSATDLRYFLEVTRTLNLSRAAVRLGITQPALTQAIQKLEATLGSPLLIRSRTGVRLTRAGERIASRAGDLFAIWESIHEATQAETTEIRGRFRIGCHPAVGAYALPTFLRELAKQAPNLEVQLVHDLSRRITEAVIDFRVDLGFVVNPVPHPDLVLRKLGTDVVEVFEAEQGRYTDDLFGDPELLQTQHILKKVKQHDLAFRRFVACPNLELIRSLVASGAGYGVLPGRVARSGTGTRLVPVSASLPTFADKIFLAYRADALVSPASKALVRIAARALEP